jgi:hypothetical protein
MLQGSCTADGEGTAYPVVEAGVADSDGDAAAAEADDGIDGRFRLTVCGRKRPARA